MKNIMFVNPSSIMKCSLINQMISQVKQFIQFQSNYLRAIPLTTNTTQLSYNKFFHDSTAKNTLNSLFMHIQKNLSGPTTLN